MRTDPVAVTESGHLTELLYDDGENDDVLVCAAHGGQVEPGTSELAVELATRLPEATCWTTFGYDRAVGAYDAWHPASTVIEPEQYSLLDRIAERGFETVLSLHGLGHDEALVGGGVGQSRKRAVADRLDGALSIPVRPVSTGEYAGVSPDNFVNWLAAGGAGIQFELGATARSEERDAVLSELGAVARAI